MSFSSLTNEMLVEVATHLDSPKDFIAFTLTCRSWERLTIQHASTISRGMVEKQTSKRLFEEMAHLVQSRSIKTRLNERLSEIFQEYGAHIPCEPTWHRATVEDAFEAIAIYKLLVHVVELAQRAYDTRMNRGMSTPPSIAIIASTHSCLNSMTNMIVGMLKGPSQVDHPVRICSGLRVLRLASSVPHLYEPPADENFDAQRQDPVQIAARSPHTVEDFDRAVGLYNSELISQSPYTVEDLDQTIEKIETSDESITMTDSEWERMGLWLETWSGRDLKAAAERAALHPRPSIPVPKLATIGFHKEMYIADVERKGVFFPDWVHANVEAYQRDRDGFARLITPEAKEAWVDFSSSTLFQASVDRAHIVLTSRDIWESDFEFPDRMMLDLDETVDLRPGAFEEFCSAAKQLTSTWMKEEQLPDTEGGQWGRWDLNPDCWE